MSSSSSISSSDAGQPAAQPARRFWLRLARFLTLPLVFGLLSAAVILRTGELTPVRVIAWLQTFGRPFVYLAEFSDHTYQLKLDAVRLFKPEVMVMGASRANQWRSAMFKPQKFYNAGNCVYIEYDYRRMLEALGSYAPRVIIFSIDFYTFNDAWDPTFSFVSYEDIGGWHSQETVDIARKVLHEIRLDPLGLSSTLQQPYFREPLYHEPALGLKAARSGTGTRIDGSYQYGERILEGTRMSIEEAIGRVSVGRKPLQFGDIIDRDKLEEFQKFTALAREKGIALVGVTAPYAPELVDTLDHSPRHQIWREFQKPEFADWIRRQGVTYFNFTRLESFGGKPSEFVDPFHPSEPAHIRMLLTMLREPAFRALFPNLDPSELETRLVRTTPLEAYRNEF